MWWIKTRRAQNPEDYETWQENQVHPTLSKFDVGDVRTVALVEVKAILLRDRAGKPGGGKGPLLSEELSLTLLNHNEQTLFKKNELETIVRRLTPVECERLQGFPDNWTAGQTDSQRYKQMGNAVTVNVVEWVGRAVLAAEQYGERDE